MSVPGSHSFGKLVMMSFTLKNLEGYHMHGLVHFPLLNAFFCRGPLYLFTDLILIVKMALALLVCI